jgi:MYXO-CTERM domain-containing protein
LSFLPNKDHHSLEEIIIRASDQRGAFSEQSFMLEIDGATGPEEGDSDAGVNPDEDKPEPGGCGCDAAGQGPSTLLLLLFGLAMIRAKKVLR